MHLVDYNTYCVSLNRAVERRKSAREEFEREGLDFEFYTGFDNNRFGLTTNTTGISTGAIGCWLSHYMLICEIARKKKVALITEDDISLSNNFKKKLADAMQTIPADWDIAFPGWHKQRGNCTVVSPVNTQWGRINSFYGTHCFLVNGQKGAAKIVNALTRIKDHIDVEFDQLMHNHTITGYCLNASIASQKNFSTQVDKRVKQKFAFP